jgi:chromosomal replication initiation ATPase DnaA
MDGFRRGSVCAAAERSPDADQLVAYAVLATARATESAACAALGVSLAAVRTARRGPAPVAGARQLAIYLAHVGFGHSLEEIGRAFRRDRTTAAHACHRVEDRRDDARFDAMVTALEVALDFWCRAFGAAR